MTNHKDSISRNYFERRLAEVKNESRYSLSTKYAEEIKGNNGSTILINNQGVVEIKNINSINSPLLLNPITNIISNVFSVQFINGANTEGATSFTSIFKGLIHNLQEIPEHINVAAFSLSIQGMLSYDEHIQEELTTIVTDTNAKFVLVETELNSISALCAATADDIIDINDDLQTLNTSLTNHTHTGFSQDANFNITSTNSSNNHVSICNFYGSNMTSSGSRMLRFGRDSTNCAEFQYQQSSGGNNRVINIKFPGSTATFSVFPNRFTFSNHPCTIPSLVNTNLDNKTQKLNSSGNIAFNTSLEFPNNGSTSMDNFDTSKIIVSKRTDNSSEKGIFVNTNFEGMGHGSIGFYTGSNIRCLTCYNGHTRIHNNLIINGDIINDQFTENINNIITLLTKTQNISHLNTSPNRVQLGVSTDISGDLYVTGTIYYNGDVVLVNTTNLQVEEDYVYLRHDNELPLGANEYSGIIIENYNGESNGSIVINSDGFLKVGDVGDEVTILARTDNIPNNSILFYDSTNYIATDKNSITLQTILDIINDLTNTYTKSDADDRFSLTTHLHDDRYSLLSHDHITEYSDINHNHDNVYAFSEHNHDSVYSLLTHLHDDRYPLINHTHSTYVNIVDLTTTLSEYSLTSHLHDDRYSQLGHSHGGVYVETTDLVDINNKIQNLNTDGDFISSQMTRIQYDHVHLRHVSDIRIYRAGASNLGAFWILIAPLTTTLRRNDIHLDGKFHITRDGGTWNPNIMCSVELGEKNGGFRLMNLDYNHRGNVNIRFVKLKRISDNVEFIALYFNVLNNFEEVRYRGYYSTLVNFEFVRISTNTEYELIDDDFRHAGTDNIRRTMKTNEIIFDTIQPLNVVNDLSVGGVINNADLDSKLNLKATSDHVHENTQKISYDSNTDVTNVNSKLDISLDKDLGLNLEQKINTMIETKINTLLENLYPVGSLFISAKDGVTPYTQGLPGYWLPENNVYIKGADGVFDIPSGLWTFPNAGSRGGNNNHEVVLNVQQLPPHSHTFTSQQGSEGIEERIFNSVSNSNRYYLNHAHVGSAVTDSTGSANPINIEPRYLNTAIWRRHAFPF